MAKQRLAVYSDGPFHINRIERSPRHRLKRDALPASNSTTEVVMKTMEGVLNQMTAKLVRSARYDFDPAAFDAWGEIFDRTVGKNLDRNGLKSWDKKNSRFVLHVVALTGRKAARMADEKEEVTISAETLRAAADYEIFNNRNKHCPKDESGAIPMGVWCPDE